MMRYAMGLAQLEASSGSTRLRPYSCRESKRGFTSYTPALGQYTPLGLPSGRRAWWACCQRFRPKFISSAFNLRLCADHVTEMMLR